MCGIAGMVQMSIPVDRRVLEQMRNAIAHRGSDQSGLFVSESGHLGLVHTRLSIIDLSEGGLQPMSDRSGRFRIVFNGEIYNFRELRSELERVGVSFRSSSDTEVILEGFAKWGEAIFLKLRGMFAIGIWDERDQALTLARDRIGKKPLFYASSASNGLAFASELKAFRSVIPLERDEEAIRLFFGLQYVPTPRTGYLGIKQLEPGSVLKWKDGQIQSIHAYHSWEFEIIRRSRSDRDQKIRAYLEDAVKIRMLATDVPVGAFLSGGVDSAAVVAYARPLVDQLSTFTMGFAGDPEMDEREAAQEIATQFHTDHHAFEAKPEDLLAIGDELIRHYDVPYADSSALPLWLLARETAKSVKVVLTGDGGDEAFGGYRRYAAYQYARMVSKLPGAKSLFPTSLRELGMQVKDAGMIRFGDLLSGFVRGGYGYAELFCGAYFNSRDARQFFQPDFLARTASADPSSFIRQRMGGKDSLDAAMHFDLISYLPDDLNVKMDRATMRWGLEARAPFLDQELVQFALSIPSSEKIAWGKTKVALKRALRDILPATVLDRPKKGFQVPLATWFRGPLADAWKDRCLDPQGSLAIYVKLDEVKRLFEENQNGMDHGNRLWMLYSLATWLQTV